MTYNTDMKLKPRLYITQHLTPMVNRYEISTIGPDGSSRELAAFAQQKRLAMREKVHFYTDETKSKELFSFRAEKVLDVHGRFIVDDQKGKELGSFKKLFGKSLLQSTWELSDKHGKVMFHITEKSKWMAYARRVIEFIPVVGDLADIIMPFVRYHFVLTDANTGKQVGNYEKTASVRDHYLLSMTDGAYKKSDWRALAALSVALDALQSR